MYRITFLDKYGDEVSNPVAHFTDYCVRDGGVLELGGLEGQDPRAFRLFAPNAWQSALIYPVCTNNKEN